MRKKKVMGIWEGIIWMEKRALKLISQINLLSLLLLANIKTRLLEFGITSFLLVNPTPTLPLTDTDRSFCQNIFYFLFLILALDWWLIMKWVFVDSRIDKLTQSAVSTDIDTAIACTCTFCWEILLTENDILTQYAKCNRNSQCNANANAQSARKNASTFEISRFISLGSFNKLIKQ
jgi:hypothetical protein